MSTCISVEQIQAQLRPAKIGNVPFKVNSTTEDFGHRVVVHEFPMSNRHYSESLGRKARTISIEGYVPGFEWLTVRPQLIAIAESGQATRLRHPFYRRLMMVKVQSLNIQTSKDELGLTRFTMECVEELPQDTISPLAFLLYRIRSALDDLIGVLADAFYLVWQVRNFDDMVRAAARGAIQDWVSILDAVRITTPSTSGSSAALAATLRSMDSNVDRIIDSESGGTYALTRYLPEIVGGFRASDADAAVAHRAFIPYLYEDTHIVERTTGSVSSQQRRKIERIVTTVMRRTAGAIWAAYSTRIWPPIPRGLGHPFHEHLATCSTALGHPWIGGL